MKPIKQNTTPVKEEPISIDKAAADFGQNKGLVAYFTSNDIAVLVRRTHEVYGFLYLKSGSTSTLKHESRSARSAIESALKFINSGSNQKSHSLGFYKSITDLANFEK